MNKETRNKKGAPYLGMKLGRLFVEECLELSIGDINSRGLYKCRCDCGNVVEVKGTGLKSSKRSCGCLQYEARFNTGYRKRRPDKVTYTIQHQNHQKSAKERDYVPLDRDTWMTFVTKECYYCGELDRRNSMTQKANNKHFINGVTTEEIAMYEVPCNGIDRVNSKKGYELDNIVPCCAHCNYMKIQYPQDKFLKKAELIHTYTTYNKLSLSSFLCN